MSQRGRGSGRGGDELEEQDVTEEQADESVLLPPAAARPIAPYDPYRPRPVDAYALPTRRPTRPAGDGPFLSDDDPLNADAWQLELDEVDSIVVDELPVREFEPELELERELPSPPRRAPRTRVPRTEREAAAPARPGRRARPAAARSSAPRGGVTIAVPRAVTSSPLATDRTALILLGVSAAGVFLMALLLGVRLGAIPSPTVLQLNAAGEPNRWGPPSVLWRLPLMSFFTIVMFLVVAWFLYPVDRFGARVALAAPIVVQLIAWVAVIQHIG